MPESVPIERVDNVGFLSVSGGLETKVITASGQLGTFPVTMEVYNGLVLPNFSQIGLNINIRRDEIRSFVPFMPMRVKAYPRDSLIDVTAMASPASFAGKEDEEVIVGVDNVVSVLLESQPFGECLVMRASLAALNARIFRYTYQVTLLVSEGAKIVELDPLNPGTTPA